jgi:hypothetical protein
MTEFRSGGLFILPLKVFTFIFSLSNIAVADLSFYICIDFQENSEALNINRFQAEAGEVQW